MINGNLYILLGFKVKNLFVGKYEGLLESDEV